MNCLIIEDEKDLYDIISSYLEKEDIISHWAKCSKDAFEILKEYKIDLIIMDIELKEEKNGLELIGIFKKKLIDIIVVTGHIEYKRQLLNLLKDGIILDFFIKPIDFFAFSHRIKILKEKYKLGEGEDKDIFENYGIVGISKPIRNLLESIKFISKKDINVLIEGESGVGKDLVARVIHKLSQKKGNFVPLNCASIPISMAEAELFGVKKGAATDVSERRGKILSANNGTLFLNEISLLPISIQGKFLRVVEEKKFFPLGSDMEVYSDFRLISASNEDLKNSVKQKKFREDLYFRISKFKIYIPPLRERKEDIPHLSKNTINNLSRIYNEEKEITDEAIEVLCSFEWRGNVRELQSVLECAYLFDKDGKINSYDLFNVLKSDTPPPPKNFFK